MGDTDAGGRGGHTHDTEGGKVMRDWTHDIDVLAGAVLFAIMGIALFFFYRGLL
jgi:hypothetical protein